MTAKRIAASPAGKRGLMFIAAMIGVLVTMLLALVQLSWDRPYTTNPAVNMFGTKTGSFLPCWAS